MHIRTSVRRAVGEILRAHPGLAGVTVHTARSRPIGLKGGDRKALEVLIPRETSDRINAPREDTYERMIDVQIVGYASAGDDDDAADAGDDLAQAVEKALAVDPSLGDIAVDCWLTGTDMALDPGVYSRASFAQTWRVDVTASLADM